MERCPTETLHQIFAIACTDGGYTARSLSQVSHTIRHKSRYSLFHSVSCHTSAQVLSFARILEETPTHLRVVRHLCLMVSYAPRDVCLHGQAAVIEHAPRRRRASFGSFSFRAPSRRFGINSTPIFLEDDQKRDEDEDDGQKQLIRLDGHLHRAIMRILSISAPFLYTLSLYVDCFSWLFFPFPPSFPSLTDLSLKHPFKTGIFRSDALIFLKSCPKLRRLVLTGYTHIIDPWEVIDRIKAFGPLVSHLCMPYNAQNMPVFLEALKSSMMPTGASTSTTPTPTITTLQIFPQTLERLFIHSFNRRGEPFARVCSMLPNAKRLFLVERTWDNNNKSGPTERGMRVREGEREGHLGAWEAMWIDVMCGGDGYWVYPDGYSEEMTLGRVPFTHI